VELQDPFKFGFGGCEFNVLPEQGIEIFPVYFEGPGNGPQEPVFLFTHFVIASG
jgi:hypothetical protein